jgi:hypothetical protein
MSKSLNHHSTDELAVEASELDRMVLKGKKSSQITCRSRYLAPRVRRHPFERSA